MPSIKEIRLLTSAATKNTNPHPSSITLRICCWSKKEKTAFKERGLSES